MTATQNPYTGEPEIFLKGGRVVGPYEHTGAYRPGAQADSPMAEPDGLWAVVEHRPVDLPAAAAGDFYIKGPGGFNGGSYWFALGGEDGWGWDQVINWPGEVRLVRGGAVKDES